MKEKLTTAFGAPVADNNNSLTAGPKGPMLMQDVWYLEKMAHFDREVSLKEECMQKVLEHLELLQ